ncbi:protocatechuate 3,4-dioxygenase subunit alpha [Paracoccaceae bacterium GXU_MW_L88]
MVQKLDTLPVTPSQTAGPYVHIGTAPDYAGLDPVPYESVGKTTFEAGAKGEEIVLTFRVIDGAGMELKDVLVEIWQADAEGRYPGQEGADPKVTGFARRSADFDSGIFRLETIKPGAIDRGDGSTEPPHLNLWIVARGVNTGLSTRVYFPEDDLSADPLLARIEHKTRIATLVAEKSDEGYHHDIYLQGPKETVFFDI